jgi:hypothetical protein
MTISLARSASHPPFNRPRLAQGMRSSLARETVKLVLCSPMQWARETRELAGLGDKAVIHLDLVELRPIRGCDAEADPRGRAGLADPPRWMTRRVPGPGGCAGGPGDSPGPCGRWRRGAIRPWGCAARARNALDRTAGGCRAALPAEYGHARGLGYCRDIPAVRVWNVPLIG